MYTEIEPVSPDGAHYALWLSLPAAVVCTAKYNGAAAYPYGLAAAAAAVQSSPSLSLSSLVPPTL